MDREDISPDEREIIEGWRLVKRHRKGYLHVVLQSDGTQFYLEITPAKQGRINLKEKNNGLHEKSS